MDEFNRNDTNNTNDTNDTSNTNYTNYTGNVNDNNDNNDNNDKSEAINENVNHINNIESAAPYGRSPDPEAQESRFTQSTPGFEAPKPAYRQEEAYKNPETNEPVARPANAYTPAFYTEPPKKEEQERYQDKFDDLKTAPFYNESYKKPGKGRLKGIIAPLIIVALLSSILSGGLVGAYFTFAFPQNNSTAQGGNKPSGVVGDGTVKQIEIVDNSTTTAPASAVAEKVSPSIVGINVTYQYNDMFFGSQSSTGQGSGIIYKSEGYILTNNHVIEAAMDGTSARKIANGAKIEVILPNQKETPYTAEVIGRDENTDLAVLKINASELPAVDFANSDNVKVGEVSIAIGNPAGLEFMGSVTQGIISGLNREITFENGKTMKLIQTDAAINPGNSGGALLNIKGEVIGINSSKLQGTGYEGLGFAIPSNKAVEIADSLISDGYVKGRPQLGISVDTRYTEEMAERNKLPFGIYVGDVTLLSGAAKAGIKANDIITKFNGVEIKSFNELENEKNKFKAGDTVEITLYRMPESGDPTKGEYLTVKVTLGEDKGE